MLSWEWWAPTRAAIIHSSSEIVHVSNFSVPSFPTEVSRNAENFYSLKSSQWLIGFRVERWKILNYVEVEVKYFHRRHGNGKRIIMRTHFDIWIRWSKIFFELTAWSILHRQNCKSECQQHQEILQKQIDFNQKWMMSSSNCTNCLIFNFLQVSPLNLEPMNLRRRLLFSTRSIVRGRSHWWTFAEDN